MTAPLASPAAPSPAPSARLVALCLTILYTVWSSTYLALRYVVEEMPALGTAGARFVLAGLVLLFVVRARRIPLPTVPQMRIAALSGLLVFTMGNGFVALAEQTASSGLASVVCASMPCFAVVFEVLGGRKIGAREVVGILLGFAGVVVLSFGALGGGPRDLRTCLLFVAPIAWALGAVIGRRFFGGAHVLATAAFQMLGGGLGALALSFLSGEQVFAHGPPSMKAWVALAYLVVMGSLVAFSAYAWLLANTSMAVATSYAFVNPVIALFLGVAVAHETVGRTVPLAVALVLGGLFLVLRKPAAVPSGLPNGEPTGAIGPIAEVIGEVAPASRR